MKTDLSLAIRQLAAERGLPPNIVMKALEAALIAAYRKAPDAWAQNVEVVIDPDTGETRVYAQLAVVEEVRDRRTQISLADARRVDPEAKIGDTIRMDVTPKDFGRIAAQTAKQVILQRIREAERDAAYHTYANQEGEIIQGTVQTITPQGITVGLDKTEAHLPRQNQMPNERYELNQRIRVYVQEVRKTPKGPEIIVSRTQKNMLRRLMELEVPEIFNGTVEIKAIAREAGSRSKVAVAARQEGVDPVGACVGIRGVRIQALVNELSGEKIDVVAWDPDPAVFIANALSPAKVTSVKLKDTPEGRTAEVVVPDNQLSLAIGKEGQNARLAAKLTGWRIDIKSESEAAEEALRRAEERARKAAELKALEEARALLAEAEARGAEEAVIDKLEEEIQAREQELGIAAGAEIEEEKALAVEPEVEVAADEESEKKPPVIPEEIIAEWLEEEEDEEIELDRKRRKKKKKKRKQRRLVYDEDMGEIIAQKRRKPGRRGERWEYEIERWKRGELDEFDEDEF